MHSTVKELHAGRVVTCYAGRPLNVNDMLQRNLTLSADQPAVADGTRRISHREQDAQAAALAAQGVSEGNRVALMLGNQLEAGATWRLALYGSAPMPEPTIGRFAQAFPQLQMCNCYGATETTSPAIIMPPGDGVAHADSFGKPVPCGDICVMDELGREVPCGQEGELWIAGPMVIPGYSRNSEAAARRYCAERMADYKAPCRVIVGRGWLPRNANGKIQKAELRAIAKTPAVSPRPAATAQQESA